MAESERTTCVVVGGGPAGMVLALLLARAGVEVTVLEKHADFLRDFRGDTVHPTTLGLLDDLGLFEEFDALPQSHLTHVAFPSSDADDVVLADFGRLRLRHPYIAMVPQWDLLDLLATAGRREAAYTLRTEHEVTGVVRDGGRVVGVEYRTPHGDGRLLADLVVACDGRWSVVRRELGLPARAFPVDFDAWWFRVPTSTPVGESLLPRMTRGRLMIAIPRRGYLQVAYLGWKGTDAELRARGVEALRAEVAEVVPELAGDVGGIASMDDVKHLDVRLDRLRRWHVDGLLCIGDAAHAMSPIGGVGINLAVQDAVAAATLLAGPLLGGCVGPADLERVRRRRLLPTVAVQTLQRLLHRNFVEPVLAGRAVRPPAPVVKLLESVPAVSFVPAYLIGVGIRPEHAPAFARRDPEGQRSAPADVRRQ